MDEYCGQVCALEGNVGMLVVASQGRDLEPSKVKLLSSPEIKVLDSFSLLPNEAVTALATTNKLEDVAGDVVLIGTSFLGNSTSYSTSYSTPFDEGEEMMEAEKGRLIILAVSSGGKRLKLQCVLEVDGGVNALDVAQGRLLACVNADNRVYKYSAFNSSNSSFLSTSLSPPNQSSTSTGSNSSKGVLQCLSVTPGQIMGVSLSTRGKHVLVGDLLKSVSLYELTDQKRLSLVMNDVSPHWILQAHLFMTGNSNNNWACIASDTFGNVLLYGTAPDPFISNRSVLQVNGGCFLGTPIVKILPNDSHFFDSHFLLIGENGQAWELSKCEEDQFPILKRLEDLLVGRLAPMHHQHRQLSQSSDCALDGGRIVDGDLLVRFLDLPFKEKEEIAGILGMPAPVIGQILQK